MRSTKQSFIIGRQPVAEALRAGTPIERIFIQRNSTGDIIGSIREQAYRNRIPVNSVPPEKLSQLSRGNHQGCIAIVSLVTWHDLQDVISFVVEKGEVPLFLMLDGITDVRNVGAIARSAVCCGAQAIVLPDKGTAPLNEEAMKASAGALEHLYVCREANLVKAAGIFKLNGIRILASDARAEISLPDCSWQLPSVVVMGSEDKGVQPALAAAADESFRIPMASTFDSFNVSVAAGIILYEASRQRMR